MMYTLKRIYRKTGNKQAIINAWKKKHWITREQVVEIIGEFEDEETETK